MLVNRAGAARHSSAWARRWRAAASACFSVAPAGVGAATAAASAGSEAVFGGGGGSQAARRRASMSSGSRSRVSWYSGWAPRWSPRFHSSSARTPEGIGQLGLLHAGLVQRGQRSQGDARLGVTALARGQQVSGCRRLACGLPGLLGLGGGAGRGRALAGHAGPLAQPGALVKAQLRLGRQGGVVRREPQGVLELQRAPGGAGWPGPALHPPPTGRERTCGAAPRRPSTCCRRCRGSGCAPPRPAGCTPAPSRRPAW